MNDRPDDWQLLDAYGTTRSEDAFARLVARHADLVYHAALRRTRRPDLAEDVAQAVFITLARSAGRLRPRGSLAAWLHQTALFASASVLRSESRRRRHERAAAHDPSDQTGTSFESSNGEIDPATEIEQALHRLRESDRQLLALHYLEGQTMQRTAKTLGISLQAARKRLTRALDRLRRKLRLPRRGETLTAAAIASTLQTLSTGAGAADASQIATTVVAGGNGGLAFTLAGDLLRAMRLVALKKAATAVVTAALLMGAVRIAILQLESPHRADADVVVYPQLPQQMADPALATPTGASTTLPDAIRSALSRNASQLAPISVTWKNGAESPLSLKHFIHVTQMSDWSAKALLNERSASHFEFDDGKYRAWLWTDYPATVVDSFKPEHETSFDGKFCSIGDVTQDEQGKFHRRICRIPMPRPDTSPDAQFANDSYLLYAGYKLPVTNAALREQRRGPLTHLDELLKSGGKLAVVEETELPGGRKVPRVRVLAPEPRWKYANALPPQRVYVFDLDPQLNYAIVRSEERTPDGRLFTRTACSDFIKLSDRDLHLPRKIEHYVYGAIVAQPQFYLEPYLLHTFQTVEISTAPIPSERFTLTDKTPGTIIQEGIGAAVKSFYIDETGAIQPGHPPRPATRATTKASK